MAFLKKNGFWISSFVLTAAMIGTFFYATGAINKLRKDRETKIDGAIGKVEGVKRVNAEPDVNAHPNQQTEEGMKEKLGVLSDSVIAAWNKRYKAQRNIMKWPAELLSQDFIDKFESWSPPETLPAEEKGQSVRMKNLLDIYQQQIPGQMKNICSVIQTNWIHQTELDVAADAARDGSDEEGDDTSGDDSDDTDTFETPTREIVEWNPINQDLWLAKLTSFDGRDDNEFKTPRPTPSQVLMLQQDLWLLEAMFDIIRVVNAQLDSDGNPILGDDGRPKMIPANDLARVKRIDHVVFGREALSLLGEITDTINVSGGSSSGKGLGARTPGRGGPGGARAPRGRGRQTKSKASDAAFAYLGKPAFHGRYVNENLEPIESETIRKIVESETLPADNLELLIAKRVPVRLAVQMDEREIPRFLAACANSPFAFEVWQVRINKHDPEEVIALRGGEATGNANGLGGGPQAGGFGASDDKVKVGPVKVAVRRNYDVGVEFYGIVKIYNPVKEALLSDDKNSVATP